MAHGRRWAGTVAVWLAAACALAGTLVLQIPVADALRTDPRVGTGVSELPVTAQAPTDLFGVLEPHAADADAVGAQIDGVPAPGGTVVAAVLDAATGEVIAERGQGPATPASSMKVLTGIVALDVLGPDTRFTTDALLNDDGTLILRGGGDPYLSSAPSAGYPETASLAELATQTAAALAEQGIDSVQLGYDAGLFGGPAWNPEWPESFKWSVAPVRALTVDHGRPDLSLPDRAEDPAQLAAERFAEALADEGITVTETAAGGVGEGASRQASVSSPTVSTMVEQMLLSSDNDAAETLAWQVALARGEKPNPETSAAVLTAELQRLGLWSESMKILDGNGIADASAVSPTVLAQAIYASIGDARLRPITTGLPVAGVSGTLTERFTDDATAGRGLVRAKTGTIRGINTLTGYVVTDTGEVLAFSFMVSGVGQESARLWLDEVGAALASCGCAREA